MLEMNFGLFRMWNSLLAGSSPTASAADPHASIEGFVGLDRLRTTQASQWVPIDAL